MKVVGTAVVGDAFVFDADFEDVPVVFEKHAAWDLEDMTGSVVFEEFVAV